MFILTTPPAIQAPPQGPPPGGPMGQHGGHPPLEIPLLRVARDLNLSDDQSVKLHAVCKAHLDALETKGLAFHQAQRAVHEAVQAPGISARDLASLISTAAARESELMEEVRQTTAEGWQVLTPAQRDKAKALMANPPERAPRHGGPMDGPGRGPGGSRGPQDGPQGPPPDGPED